jgi:uncharacterized protein YbjT (DUF2867 family)
MAEASGMGYTHLRPNLCMQGLLFAPMIAAEERLYAPIGDARVSLIDVRDIAAVAAKALTESGHEGKTDDLTGAESLTHAELAAQLGEAIGRSIAFVDIPGDLMCDAALNAGMPAWQADGLIEDYAHYHRGEAAEWSPAVQQVTGRAAWTFRAFARDFRAAFAQAGTVGPSDR